MFESLKDLSKLQLLHKRTISYIYSVGRIVELCDDERNPIQTQLLENSHKMNNGWVYLNEKPSLGLEIFETALKKFGKLVYKK